MEIQYTYRDQPRLSEVTKSAACFMGNGMYVAITMKRKIEERAGKNSSKTIDNLQGKLNTVAALQRNYKNIAR